jgi:hypothetical protein
MNSNEDWTLWHVLIQHHYFGAVRFASSFVSSEPMLWFEELKNVCTAARG